MLPFVSPPKSATFHSLLFLSAGLLPARALRQIRSTRPNALLRRGRRLYHHGGPGCAYWHRRRIYWYDYLI